MFKEFIQDLSYLENQQTAANKVREICNLIVIFNASVHLATSAYYKKQGKLSSSSY